MAHPNAHHHPVRPAGTPQPISDYTLVEFGPINAAIHIPPVRCLYGGTPIETKGGGGVWEVQKRPYLPPLTVWKGPAEAYTHKISLVLDALGDGRNHGLVSPEGLSVQYAAIEAMAGMQLGVPLDQWTRPPVLFLNGGGGLPHDHKEDESFRWVIAEPPAWGETIRAAYGKDAGFILRQELSLTFMLFEDAISGSGSRVPVGKQGKHNPSSFEPKGMTFERIAAKKWPKKHGWPKKLFLLNRRLGTVPPLPQAMNQSTPFPTAVKIFFPSAQEEEEWRKNPGRER
jgi:hypothetical protein